LELSAGQLCTISLGNPCKEKIDQKLNWTLPLPPSKRKREVKQTPINSSKKRETFKFIQISDSHVDLDYQIGANAACNEPLCCRAKSVQNIYSRSLDADIKRKARWFGVHLSQDDELKAGKWGSYGNLYFSPYF
jgi:hypothetical protein